jgi:5-methylcytosine-specific restriction endonuclease McrA
LPFLRKKKNKPGNLPKKQTRFYTADDSFLRTSRWRSVRQIQLSTNPYCEIHQAKGVLVDCTHGGHIDHIISRSRGGAELDFSNLMTLCLSCHTSKTNLDQTIQYTGEHGERVPANGEKERIISLLTSKIL